MKTKKKVKTVKMSLSEHGKLLADHQKLKEIRELLPSVLDAMNLGNRYIPTHGSIGEEGISRWRGGYERLGSMLMNWDAPYESIFPDVTRHLLWLRDAMNRLEPMLCVLGQGGEKMIVCQSQTHIAAALERMLKVQ